MPTLDAGTVECAGDPLATDLFETPLKGPRIRRAGALQCDERNTGEFGVRLEEGVRVVFVESGMVFHGVDRGQSEDGGRRALSLERAAVDRIESLTGSRVMVAEMTDLLLAETRETVVVLGTE